LVVAIRGLAIGMFTRFANNKHLAPVVTGIGVLNLCLLTHLLSAGAPADGPRQIDLNRPGPWDNDVLVYRLGTNAAPEKLATFERAGVPTLARLKGGRILAAFQHFPSDDERNFDRVAVRSSTDEGQTWSAPQPIAVDGIDTGLTRPFDPTLVPLPDGRIRLYFTSNRSREFRRSAPAIYSAISSDGIHYTFEPGVRFGLEGRIVIDCAAALHDGTFHLIVPDNGAAGSFVAGSRRGQLLREGTGYHAVSKDGLSFERAADIKVAGNRRWLGSLQSDGGRLVFFGTSDSGVWSATSGDGKDWQLDGRPTGVPDVDPGAVRLADGGWLLAASSPPRPGTASAAVRPQPGAQPFGDNPPAVRGARPLNAGMDEADGGFGAPEGPDRPPGRSQAEYGFQGFPPLVVKPFLLRIPSSAGGEEGLAASVLFPRQPRYTNGAPVVINVIGGVQPGGAFGRPEYVGLGFVEIHFAFPGGGQGTERSGGSYDFRGPKCIRALADVIRFATGRIADKDGRRMNELCGSVNVLTNNCGLIGSSHGGNACGMAMALHGQEFADLAWYASMESPYGEGAVNVELGGRESGMNPAYNPKTGRLDLSRLAWSPDLSPGLFGKQMLIPTGSLKGAFFFDLDGDGNYSAQSDFPANCIVGDSGNGVKAWYSPRVLAEADRRRLVGNGRPSHLPSLAESREFWSYRDAAPGIPDAVRNCTSLAVIVYANERDHVQAAPDHGHILVQVEGFRQAKARFVRLNPDRSYVEQLVAHGPGPGRGLLADPARREAGRPPFPDNPAGQAFDRGNIISALEPARFSLGLYMQAAACELADRTQANQWAANLDRVLYPIKQKTP
jgi:hypothetical protein